MNRIESSTVAQVKRFGNGYSTRPTGRARQSCLIRIPEEENDKDSCFTSVLLISNELVSIQRIRQTDFFSNRSNSSPYFFC